MASDFFLKIHTPFPGEDLTHQLDHQLIKLGTDFELVSSGFNDLIADALKVNDVSQHKHVSNIKWTDALIKHDIDTIGSDFLKLSDSFLKLDDVQHKFDDAFLNFSDLFIKFDAGTPSSLETDQGGIKLSDDFIKLDTDLKLMSDSTFKLGLDFLKLDDTHTDSNPLGTLSADFQNFAHKLGGVDGVGGVGNDFAAIGSDFLKLSELTPDEIGIKFDQADLLKIDQAFIKLGNDATNVGDAFHTVSDDFLKISADIAKSQGGDQPTESISLNFAQIAIKYSPDFQQLTADTIKLDQDLKLLGTDYIKLSDALHDALHGNEHGTPVPTDTLDQVLALAQHFTLL